MHHEEGVVDLLNWTDCFAVLSSDLYMPFYEDMGLLLNHRPEEFQAAIRVVLRLHWPILQDLFSMQQMKVFVGMEEKLAEQFGSHFATQLKNWHWTIWLPWFQDHSSPRSYVNEQWAYYEILFSWWMAGKRRGEDRFGLLGSEAKLTESYRMRNEADLRRRLEVAASLPISDWDRALFASRSLECKRGITHTSDVNARESLEMVHLAASQNSFQLFWEDMLRLTSDDELIRIHRSAELYAERIGSHLRGKVWPPRSLRRAVQWDRP